MIIAFIIFKRTVVGTVSWVSSTGRGGRESKRTPFDDVEVRLSSIVKTMLFNITRASSKLMGFKAFKIISTRAFQSLTNSNKRIFKNLAVSKNHEALKIELLRVVAEASGTSDNDNFPKLTAQICVNEKKVEFDLAYEILVCLEEAKPKSMLLGLYELMDKCVDCKHLNDAMKVLTSLRNINENLDATGRHRLLTALSIDCRIKEIMIVLDHTYITAEDLTVVAEPLIMTANMKLFNALLRKFMEQSGISGSPEGNERVAEVIRSIIYARMRRHIQFGELTSEERVAIKDTLTMLQQYHALSIHVDVTQSESYFHACQLHDLERDRLSQSEMAEVEMIYRETHETNRLPIFEPSNFPYMIESDEALYRDMMGRKGIKDLTSELKRRYPSRVLLYSNAMFQDSYEAEKRLMKERNMEKFFERSFCEERDSYSLIGALEDDRLQGSDDESDSDDDGYDSLDTQYDSEDIHDTVSNSDSDSDSDSDREEVDIDAFISEYDDFNEFSFVRRHRVARTLLPAAFPINDITGFLEKKDNAPPLQFSEDIFDFGREPPSWPRVLMPGGFILSRNERKDSAMKTSPASNE